MFKLDFLRAWPIALPAVAIILAGTIAAKAQCGSTHSSSLRSPYPAPAYSRWRQPLRQPFTPPWAQREQFEDAEQLSNTDYLDAVLPQGLVRWPLENMPLRVYVAPGSNVPGYRSSYAQLVRRAFDEWAIASGHKLAWQPVASPYEADITVYWTPQLDDAGARAEAGRTVTTSRFNKRSGQGFIDGARVMIQTLSGGRPFSDGEMRRIALHEVGHALGLQGHSPFFADIMFQAIHPRQISQLTERDRATMSRLYNNYPSFNSIGMGGMMP